MKIDWRIHPKFLFIKDQINKYIANGGKLGRVNLFELNEDNSVSRCPLGVVAFNFCINISDGIYSSLKEKFDLSDWIGIGFDGKTRKDYISHFKFNKTDDELIGEEIATYCLENSWIKLG